MPQFLKKEATSNLPGNPPWDAVSAKIWSSSDDFEGGDYYGFYTLPRNHIGILIGDVPETKFVGTCNSGRILIEAKRIVEDEVMQELADMKYKKRNVDPRAVMERLDRKLMVHGMAYNAGMYPACFSVFNMRTGSLKITNAAQPPPIILSRNGKAHFENMEPQLPLGVDDKQKYNYHLVKMLLGERIVFYTDGAVEAGCRAEEPIDPNYLPRLVEDTKEMPFDRAIDYMGARIREYAIQHSSMGGLEDEITLVGLEYLKRAA